MFRYTLYSDDEEVTIIGEQSLDLEAAVQNALESFTDEEIMDQPDMGWFDYMVRNICKQTGFHVEEINEQLYVHDMYLEEYSKRHLKEGGVEF